MFRSRFHRDLSVARATLLADSAPGSPCAGKGHRLVVLHAADSELFRLGVYKRFSLPGHPDGSLRRWKSGGSLAEQDAGGLAQALQFPSVPVGRGSIRSAKEAILGGFGAKVLGFRVPLP